MVASPCREQCRLDARTKVCTGCLRTADEITRWRKMTDHQRRRVVIDLVRRRQIADRKVRPDTTHPDTTHPDTTHPDTTGP